MVGFLLMLHDQKFPGMKVKEFLLAPTCKVVIFFMGGGAEIPFLVIFFTVSHMTGYFRK